MTKRDGATADFDEVVSTLERQARLLLSRWAAIGNNHIRITGGGRIKDDELRERFTRLREAAEGLASRIADVLGDAPSVRDPINEAGTALTVKAFWKLSEPVVEAQLENAWTALLEAAANIEAILMRAAQPLGDFLQQLTPKELVALSESEAEEGRDPAPLRRLASIVELHDDVARAASEARELLSGRFHRLGGRGRPEQIRGRRLAARLLGAAEGLGLRPSRNRVPAKGKPGRSAADAILAALRRCADTEDPVAKAILQECPKEYLAVEKRLIPACVAGPKGDPLLIREYEDGKRRVAYWA